MEGEDGKSMVADFLKKHVTVSVSDLGAGLAMLYRKGQQALGRMRNLRYTS